jgi:hypothetical protein
MYQNAGFVEVCLCMALSCKAVLLPNKIRYAGIAAVAMLADQNLTICMCFEESSVCRAHAQGDQRPDCGHCIEECIAYHVLGFSPLSGDSWLLLLLITSRLAGVSAHSCDVIHEPITS